MSTRASTIRVVAGLVDHLGDESVESVSIDVDNDVVLNVSTDSIQSAGAALLKAWDALDNPDLGTLDKGALKFRGQLRVDGEYCGVTVSVIAGIHLSGEIDAALESGVPISRELIEAVTR